MILEAVNKTLQFGGPCLDAGLCALMLVKARWRTFPALFALVFLDLVSSFVLYWIDPAGVSPVYARAYLVYDVANFLLQLLILYEIAKNVLKPAGIWEREAFKPLILIATIGAIVAFVATLFLQPVGIHHGTLIQMRADTFAGLLTCEAVVAMMFSAKEVGLPWRSHVMAIGQGLMIWSLIGASIDGCEVYLGPHSPYYSALYYVRSINYLVVVGYWTVSLWYEEPARKPISPALQKYIVALHERVQYDLGKVGH